MPRRMLAAASLVAAIVLSSSPPLLAEEVVLRLKDGGFEIKGELKSFDGQTYVIAAQNVGTLQFAAQRYDCVGPACATRPAAPATRTTPAAAAPAAAARPAPAEAAGSDPAEKLAIHGSNTIGAALMPALIRGYAQSIGASVTSIGGVDPNSVQYRIASSAGREIALIALQRQGSTTAFNALAGGAAEIGMSSRPVNDEEAARLASVAPRVREPESEHVLGLDGIAIVVSPESAVAALSLDNAARVFSGKVTDWSELGLPAGKINVYSVGPNSGTFDTFASAILRPRGVGLTGNATIQATHDEVASAVARDPNAIGFTSFANLNDVRAVNIEDTCGLVVRPSVFAVKAEEYPLGRRLYLYTPAKQGTATARGLVRFALSDAARPHLLESQFIDTTVEELPLEDQTGRIAYAINAQATAFDRNLMRQLLADLKGARRLSATLRFGSGLVRLDGKAQSDLSRLVEVMQRPANKGRTLLLMGFSDTTGTIQSNLALALRRASEARTALLAAAQGSVDPRQVVARGYGPLAPIACNDTPKGQETNRRVEAWIQ